MGTLYKTDGTRHDANPANGEYFTYDELQGFIGGKGNLVEIVPLPDGRSIVVNEEGKIHGLPINERASEFWQRMYPIEKYPHNNDGLIVGDALVASEKELRGPEDD